MTLAAAALVLGACSDSDDTGEVSPTPAPTVETTDAPGSTDAPEPSATGGDLLPSEAFCSDLEAGLTPMNIYGGVRDDYSPEEFADLAYGYAAISCPDQLAGNEALRAFLENWDINPDA